ncbi:unnamed protein product [Vicia faba]|uniref:Uncharacterized protein n=1 Tax=Vicia faba TaxID=3906 RepID=A0AAV1AYC4_VICFA|nr:unnamed protein product [Vicia faba]
MPKNGSWAHGDSKLGPIPISLVKGSEVTTLHLRDKCKQTFSSILFQRAPTLSSFALSDLKHHRCSHRLHRTASPPFMSSSSPSTLRPHPNPLRRGSGFAYPILKLPSPFESMLDQCKGFNRSSDQNYNLGTHDLATTSIIRGRNKWEANSS